MICPKLENNFLGVKIPGKQLLFDDAYDHLVQFDNLRIGIYTYLMLWVFGLLPPIACRIPCAFAARCVAALYAVHANVVPALLQNELTKSFRWFCYAPTDARVITDFQVTGFGCGFEFSVVILPAPAAILYAVLHIVDVYALVEFRCNNFENASVKSACPDV